MIYFTQRMVYGTHTGRKSPNSLIIEEFYLPFRYTKLDNERDKSVNIENGNIQAFPHDGEINKARVMPGNNNIIATKGPNPDIYLYQINGKKSDVISLKGHDDEGFGLSWSTLEEGFLASGSGDGKVK